MSIKAKVAKNLNFYIAFNFQSAKIKEKQSGQRVFIFKNKVDICGGPVFSGVIRYTVPVILTNILQLLYNAADMVVVGAPYFLCGIMECLSYTNRGMHHATASMIISVFFACVFRIIWVNTMFQLPEFHSLMGLLVNFPISWVLCIIFQLVLFLVSYKKLIKAKREERT